jgi:NADPH:quinone reductase-like Zn-dependent oxidoreductase
VDTKVRVPKAQVEKTPRVLGWDAAGVVEAVGPAVTRFKPSDEVYYAGDVKHPGSNAEFQTVAVDHRRRGRRWFDCNSTGEVCRSHLDRHRVAS